MQLVGLGIVYKGCLLYTSNPGPHGGGTLTFVNVTMAYLASDLMGFIKDRQVVDLSLIHI